MFSGQFCDWDYNPWGCPPNLDGQVHHLPSRAEHRCYPRSICTKVTLNYGWVEGDPLNYVIFWWSTYLNIGGKFFHSIFCYRRRDPALVKDPKTYCDRILSIEWAAKKSWSEYTSAVLFSPSMASMYVTSFSNISHNQD